MVNIPATRNSKRNLFKVGLYAPVISAAMKTRGSVANARTLPMNAAKIFRTDTPSRKN